MKRVLPPLNALRIFEVAGRVGSFSKAGDELNLTHGAVSQQVKNLEQWLGVKLFRPAGRGIELTEQGIQYLSSINPALAAIANASSQFATRRAISINAQPALTMRWLLPRLASFREAHPGLEVNITTGFEPVEQVPTTHDVIIRRKSETAARLVRREILSELNFPVCAPQVMRQHPITVPDDLQHHTLIHSSPRPLDWPNWLKTVGAEHVVPAHALHLEFLYFALQAATDGLGIAMGTSSLVFNELRKGRLVMPYGNRFITRSTPYAMFTKPDSSPNSSVALFCNWLAEQGAQYDEQIKAFCQFTDDDTVG